MQSDLERFHAIDEVRRVCDQQGVAYELDGAFTRENLAWVFHQAQEHLLWRMNARIYQAAYRQLRKPKAVP